MEVHRRMLLVMALLALGTGRATAIFGHTQQLLVVPSIGYEIHLAMLKHNVSSILMFGCRQFYRHVNAIVPEAVGVTMVCDDQCEAGATKRTGSVQVVCTVPNATQFDMVLLDTYGDQRAVSIQDFLSVLSGVPLPKVMLVADWQAHQLDVLELPSLKLMQFSEGAPLKTNEATRVFSDIYHRKAWGPDGGASGPGSTVELTTNIRNALVDIVKQYNITSIIDAPCGSMHWMPTALAKMPSTLKYTGMDVACHLISSHRARFAEQANWDFFCADVCHQRLPPNRDLVFSRDAMQHLPLEYVFGFLSQVKASGAKYLLIGSYIKNAQGNRNIGVGDYFLINVLAPPFSMSEPLRVVDEHTTDGKHMLLFEVAKMTWAAPGGKV